MQLSAGKGTRVTLFGLEAAVPGIGLFGMMVPAPRRPARRFRKLGLLPVIASLLAGCADGVSASRPATPPATYTFTVAGTSGSLQHTLPLTLTVQ